MSQPKEFWVGGGGQIFILTLGQNPPLLPQGPCHIKNTTVILIHYGGAHQYDGSKTRRQGL